mmetsp:Transcript_27282/g.69391  ORF Transcript_27282/g.69391 Transcript_27282/m.69391 type:complete len:221 (-) Transcript_27282:282-944(-)
MPLRWPGDRGHQRRGDARPVGVPDRAMRRRRGRRPDDGVAVYPEARVRGLWRARDARPKAHRRRLERRGHAHQLLHREDAQAGRHGRDRASHPPPRSQARRAHRGVRRGQRTPPDGQVRDGRHQHILLRCRQPRLLHPHPTLDRGRRLRLPRGPPPLIQLRPICGHQQDLRDDDGGRWRRARHQGIIHRPGRLNLHYRQGRAKRNTPQTTAVEWLMSSTA